jgi:chromosomal replication initiator protein
MRSEKSTEIQEKWRRCLDFISHNVAPDSYSTWFTPIVFEGIKKNVAVLRVPSQFFYEYIEEHFIGYLRAAIKREFGEKINIGYNIVTDSINNINATALDNKGAVNIERRPETDGDKTPSFLSGLEQYEEIESRLNPNYTFENFIEGESNKLPRSIGLAIADNPGQKTFNPFFIYGSSGVGKTHLLNAIGIRIKEKTPAKRVLYVSAHLFLIQYSDATRRNLRNDFLHFYQSIDVLLIDDIQEIAGETRKATQEAFFHIFNHLQQTGHQLIMTSDRPPVELEGVEERLLTRFKWGLVAELYKPDVKLARKILINKMHNDGLVFPKDVIDYIAVNASQNIRDLEGVINAILAYSVVYNCDVDINLAQKVIGRSIKPAKNNITTQEILNRVADFYKVSSRDICSSSRIRKLSIARQVSMYLAQKHTGLSYAKIGSEIGGRDHSTVLHSCTVVSKKISTDIDFRHSIESIESHL